MLKILDSSGPDQGDEPILDQLPDSEPLVCWRGLYHGGHFVAKNLRGRGKYGFSGNKIGGGSSPVWVLSFLIVGNQG